MNCILALLLVMTPVADAAERCEGPPGEQIERRKSPASAAVAPAKGKRGVRYEGGDGSSMEKAVVIKGAKDTSAGVRAEYDWVEKKFPGYQRKQQSLRGDEGKHYDVLTIITKDGKEVDVYFDITDFFGKF